MQYIYVIDITYKLWYNKEEYGNGGGIMDIRVNDEIIMKKPHPCGSYEFTVLRIGMDFRIHCKKCGHEIMVPRQKIEKNIKKVFREGEEINA